MKGVCAVPAALYERIAVGDLRPIAVDISPSDNAQIVSATCYVTRRSDPCGVIWDAGGPCLISYITGGFRIATPDLIRFATADVYTVAFQIVWDDAQIDNSVTAIVPVTAIPH